MVSTSKGTKKMGLGKGLGALLPAYSINEEKKEENPKVLHDVLLTEIKPNPKQPRKNVDEKKLSELASSIKEHGVIQPIVICELPEGGYQIIAGERRWRACRIIGKETIPAVVTKHTGVEATEVALIENLQREDLSPLEEAVAYQSLINEFGLTQQEVAKRVSKSRSLVTNMLRLLVLPGDILSMLNDGRLSIGHARALLTINETKSQIAVAKEIIKKQLSVRETEKLVKKLINSDKNTKKQKPTTPELIDIQEQLQSVFSTKVQIKGNPKGKGKLEIEFYNQDDLTRILDIMFHVKH